MLRAAVELELLPEGFWLDVRKLRQRARQCQLNAATLFDKEPLLEQIVEAALISPLNDRGGDTRLHYFAQQRLWPAGASHHESRDARTEIHDAQVPEWRAAFEAVGQGGPSIPPSKSRQGIPQVSCPGLLRFTLARAASDRTRKLKCGAEAGRS